MRWAAVLLCSVAVTLATVRSADGQDLIADDHYAYNLRALGDVVTGVHGTYDENGPHGPVVELYRHVDGRTTAARCCADQEYQDLGRDRRGRIVQVLGYSGGFGSVGQHAPPPPVFML